MTIIITSYDLLKKGAPPPKVHADWLDNTSESTNQNGSYVRSRRIKIDEAVKILFLDGVFPVEITEAAEKTKIKLHGDTFIFIYFLTKMQSALPLNIK